MSTPTSESVTEKVQQNSRASPPPHRRHRARSFPVPRGRTAVGGRSTKFILSVNTNNTQSILHRYLVHLRFFQPLTKFYAMGKSALQPFENFLHQNCKRIKHITRASSRAIDTHDDHILLLSKLLHCVRLPSGPIRQM